MGWLNGQVALVTGGGSGIGLAVVRRFIAEGARVGVLTRSASHIAHMKKEFGDNVVVVAGDVRSVADNQKALDETLRAYGKLDTFVGNAGVYDFFTSLSKLDPEKISAGFDEIFGINVKGYLIGARITAAELKKTEGSMIFTLSNSAFYAGGGGPMYVASKHAVVGLVRQLAYELAPKVRVNGVAPGGTHAPLRGLESMGTADTRLTDNEGFDQMVANFVPLGFTAKPEDHAGHYVLLASKENSRFTTGHIIHSDGGWEVRGRPAKRDNKPKE